MLAMVGVLLGGGCASTQRQCFSTNEQLTQREVQQQFEIDRYQCVQESRTYWSGGGSGLVGLSAMASAQASANKQANQLYEMCMKSKGYVIVDVPKGKTWTEFTLEEKIKVAKQLCPTIPINGEALKSSKHFREYRELCGYSMDRCLQR